MTAEQGKTPRVEAALAAMDGMDGISTHACVEMTAVARTLETELSAALVRAERAEEAYRHLQGVVERLQLKPNKAPRPSFFEYEVLPPDGSKAP